MTPVSTVRPACPGGRPALRGTLRATLLALCISTATAVAATAQDAVVASTVDAVIEAYGGAEALDSVRALRLQGTLTAHTRGANGVFVRISEGTDRIKVLLHYARDTEIRIVEGETGWRGPTPDRLAPATGMLLGAMRLQAARAWVPWVLRELRDELVLQEAGDDRIVLGAPVGPGMALRFFIDPASHRVLRSESALSAGGRTVVFATDYGDFRMEDGLLIAHREETFASGVHTATQSVTRVVVNPDEAERKLPLGG